MSVKKMSIVSTIYIIYLHFIQVTNAFQVIPTTTATYGRPKQRFFATNILQNNDEIHNHDNYQSSTKSKNDNDDEIITKKGPLSMTIEELGTHLGGNGRAKAAWDCLRIGIDPLHYFTDTNISEKEKEYMASFMPARRKTEGMGKRALSKLVQLYGGFGIEETVGNISHVSVSSDRTTKLLIRLKNDGLEVETVIIPWFDRGSSTLCISSQVGCRQGCTFCATGRMGLLRSLSTDEILCQIFLAQKTCLLSSLRDNTPLPPIDNIVFMGMGEPADNLDAISTVVIILTDRSCFQFSQAKVTVSTVGPNPESVHRLGVAPCALAWSVHAVRDELRRKLIPTASKYSVSELRQAFIDVLCKRPKRLRTIMIEVALIDSVNDSMEDAKDLADFCQVMVESVPDIKLVINLIPWNDIGNHPVYRKPSKENVFKFQNVLLENGLYSFIRITRGDDEDAACGQLTTKKKRKREEERVVL